MKEPLPIVGDVVVHYAPTWPDAQEAWDPPRRERPSRERKELQRTKGDRRRSGCFGKGGDMLLGEFE
jgi:hypothetical protein